MTTEGIASKTRGSGYHPRSLVRLLPRSKTMMVVMRSLLIVMVTVMLVMMGFISLAETLLAVEDQEVHAEGIEGSDEDTRQHGEIGEAGAGNLRQGYRLDDRVLGVETGQERRANQGQESPPAR